VAQRIEAYRRTRHKERVLVAGGAGFIGSHLCQALLARGDEVVCIDNLQTSRPVNLRPLEHEPRFDFIEGDVVNPLPIAVRNKTPGFTRIYNLACAASPPQYQADPEHTMLTNVLGAHHLLRLAEEQGARFLLSSTSEVYGDPEAHPQREEYRGSVNCIGPRACYDEGKRAAEALCFDYARLDRVSVRVARIFNTYGPQMHPDDGRVISNLICQALAGREITVYGDGSQTRSFCYVDDMVDGLIRLMEHEGELQGPVNLGNPNEMTVNELLERVIALTGATAAVVYRPLPTDDPRRRRPDISRAREILGWQPQVSLERGLRATCDFFAAEICEAPPGVASERMALHRSL
jgi:UDP-glucuronate decarboxylase